MQRAKAIISYSTMKKLQRDSLRQDFISFFADPHGVFCILGAGAKRPKSLPQLDQMVSHWGDSRISDIVISSDLDSNILLFHSSCS